ncbi:MAG: hypothetical protein K5860_11055 [Bacteroidales bacterium]|nr:hypothetical protein [Bacteroidales bacterium]
MLISDNGVTYPVEIKKNASPDNSAIKNFNVFSSLNLKAGEGAVICLSSMTYPLDNRNKVVPVGLI